MLAITLQPKSPPLGGLVKVEGANLLAREPEGPIRRPICMPIGKDAGLSPAAGPLFSFPSGASSNSLPPHDPLHMAVKGPLIL